MTDAERAERLAAIRARRGQAPIDPGFVPPQGDDLATASGDSVDAMETERSEPARRRRSAGAATGSKIAVAGVSATAVLGIIAGLGWTQRQSEPDSPAPAAAVPAAPMTANSRVETPSVVVVVLGDETRADDSVADRASAVAQEVAAAVAAATPEPIPAAQAVDLAIPTVAPSASEPQATSSGS